MLLLDHYTQSFFILKTCIKQRFFKVHCVNTFCVQLQNALQLNDKTLYNQGVSSYNCAQHFCTKVLAD